MDGWAGKLVDMCMGGLPGVAAALVPEHMKKQWLARVKDYDPFKSVSANHDLVRATRLAWIEAAQDVLKEARAQSSGSEWRGEAAKIETFHGLITDILLDVRHNALDRGVIPVASVIDEHVKAVIAGVPELVSPGDHSGTGAEVTFRFAGTLAGLSGWDQREIPAVYAMIASQGLATRGGGPRRPFGELVFAAFAEIIKDPKKYPQAREAFYIAMDQLGRDIGRATLDSVKGIDAKFDELAGSLDALDILREGAIAYLDLLPKIADDTAATRRGVEEILRRLAQDEGVPLATLRAILSEMGEAADAMDSGQITAKLKAKAGEFRELTDRLNRLSNDDPEVQRLRRSAAASLSAGRFAQADAELAAAEARDLDSLEDLEALAKSKRLSAAESRAERGAAAKLRTNPDAYREAASHYGEAARIARAADPSAASAYDVRKGQVLIDLGKEFGVNSALREAIEQFQGLLRSVRRTSDGLHWAEIQHNLGIALWTLGARESGTARLEEAVEAYRAALEEWTRERVPLDWAGTQNNLGIALQTLGARESGTARLEEAVEAYRAALEEQTRERVPLDWAMTQNNLGTALQTLGERESGTARLEEAVEAYRAALEEYTRERVPLDWAMTQNNLGAALSTLGERESGTARLEEAVEAYRAALEEQTRERVPLDWATTQNNLGAALRTLGERESGTARLEEAVEAYRAALEEYTRERVPLGWAMSFGNQGVASRRIAERRNDIALAETALAQIEDAHQTFVRADHAPYAAFYAEQADLARELLARLTDGQN